MNVACQLGFKVWFINYQICILNLWCPNSYWWFMPDIRTLNGQNGFEKAPQLLTVQDWHFKLTKLPRFCQRGFLMKRLDFLNYTAGLWRCISLMQLTGIIYRKLVYFSSLGFFIKISSYFVISVYCIIAPAFFTTFSSVSNINFLHAVCWFYEIASFFFHINLCRC